MFKMTASKPEQPDSPPKHALHIGAINPFALCEAVLGHRIIWTDPATTRLMSSILQTDYEELFDMRFRSILYAGTRVGENGDMAEPIPAKDMHTLEPRDLVTPDFSRVERLGDLDRVGLKDLDKIRVKHAVMSNGNLRLTLEPEKLGKTLCSHEMTWTLRELCTPFRIHPKEEWTPPNGSWTEVSMCNRHHATTFTNPVQGATSNSWFIAALMSVAWSDPAVIKHCTRPRRRSSGSSSGSDRKYEECSLSVKFHSKGGHKDASTATVHVNCELPTNNSSAMLMYCRPSSMSPYASPYAPPYSSHSYMMQSIGWTGELWPALYEKAFAAWLTSSSHSGEDRDSDESFDPESSSAAVARTTTASELLSHHQQHPDITQTSHGDPVKAMCQLTNKDPQYFFTSHRRGADLLGLVRTHSFNQRTIYPIVAWTRPSDAKFRGCTLVGNMAYSVLGWAAPQERKQYLILRHPWGVTEPEGMTSYPGVVSRVDAEFWPPIELVDRRGVFAIETEPFKEYFAGMGVAK
ncbi:cysteine proteinase [Parathielavia hyrcaniae]|uniref:Cysteine proteinase n=1 Tax=Parathielavia hyrcaniae TaxID=113614 RepID=A0AAN6Q4Z2_9PEZI|nr:cysteine proteinase [Parathielavia hyrcaniae]